MIQNQNFTGDKKLPLKSPFAKIERRFIDALVPAFPRWIEGYHLTLMSIPISAAVIVAGYLARRDVSWLWLSSAMLFLQWFTDSFDGSLGRYRDTGIPKWGYYMDHLLDFVFMSSLLVSYALLFDGIHQTVFLLLIPLFGLFYVNSFLSFSATKEFKITFLGTGPTELRFALIALNTAMIIWGAGIIKPVLVYVPFISFVVVCVIVFRTQKYIWAIDMRDKQDRKRHGPALSE
jgi:archaetidylinositol phosphate synthase